MEFEVVEESGLLFGFGGHKPDFQPLEGADEDEFSEGDAAANDSLFVNFIDIA